MTPLNLVSDLCPSVLIFEGEPGSGGEYVMPIGFGWTNGVALELLNKYPDLHA